MCILIIHQFWYELVLFKCYKCESLEIFAYDSIIRIITFWFWTHLHSMRLFRYLSYFSSLFLIWWYYEVFCTSAFSWPSMPNKHSNGFINQSITMYYCRCRFYSTCITWPRWALPCLRSVITHCFWTTTVTRYRSTSPVAYVFPSQRTTLFSSISPRSVLF